MHLVTFVETVLEKYLCCNVLLLKANPREIDVHIVTKADISEAMFTGTVKCEETPKISQ